MLATLTHKRHLIVMFILSGVLLSCSRFEYHPYETYVQYNQLNRKAIERILNETPNKDTITILAMADTQRFYDETEAFVASANSIPHDFVFLVGDITDFGLNDEYEWIHEIMSKLNKPYLAVIGNHDILENGEIIYKEMYGPTNFSFILNRFKFIMLNTNSQEYKFNGVVPDINWLKAQLSGDDFDHAVVVSHIPPYSGDFDKKLELPYANALSESQKVKLSLHAHLHAFQDSEPYEDGIRYVVTTSVDDRKYLRIKLFGNNFKVEHISYRK
jgi:Icc-related predicted phosphoesterase